MKLFINHTNLPYFLKEYNLKHPGDYKEWYIYNDDNISPILNPYFRGWFISDEDLSHMIKCNGYKVYNPKNQIILKRCTK